MSLEKMFESPALLKLQELGGKVQSNKTLSAISGAMMSSLSVILAGAIFVIIATLLNLVGIVQTTDPLYQFLYAPYNMTIGFMAIVIAFAAGYAYSKALGLKGEMANGIVTMVLFLMVVAPIKQVTLQDGTTSSVLDTTYLGSTGMFTALIIPIVSILIIKFCKDHNIALNMPDTVPQYLQDAFSAAIPLVICILLWTGLNTLCESVFTVPLPGAIMALLAMPLAGLNSVPGMFVIALVGLLCWVFGIHGTGVIMIVLMPLYMTMFTQNAALVEAGQVPVIQPVALYFMAQMAGGSGNMFPLALLCLRCKSDQLKAMGKVGIVPAFFNVSEPMVFGVPVMYNPLIAIPFILNTLVCMFLIYLLGPVLGFFRGTYIMIMTSMPMFVGDFLTSMAWQNLFIPVLCFVVGFVFYAPFVKMYDKQLCQQEAKAKADEEAASAKA